MPNSNRNTKPRFDSLSANCYKSNKSENANAVAAAGNWMKFVEVATAFCGGVEARFLAEGYIGFI